MSEYRCVSCGTIMPLATLMPSRPDPGEGDVPYERRLFCTDRQACASRNEANVQDLLARPTNP